MFKTIFLFELKHWLKQPSTYFYALCFSGLAFLIMLGSCGMFDTHTTGVQFLSLKNSPFEINYILNYYNKFFLFLLPAIVGMSIYRDFKYNVHQIMYSFPIRKQDYFLAKYLSAIFIVLAIVSITGLAMIIAEHIPGLDPNKLGDFNLMGYFRAFFVYSFPNLIAVGAIVFAAVSYTRNNFSGFGVVIGLFFFQAIVESVFKDNVLMIALSDPLAKNTFAYLTRFWTLVEMRTELVPIGKAIVQNRLLWIGVGLLTYLGAYRIFALREDAIQLFKRAKRGRSVVKNNFNSRARVQLPNLSFRFDVRQQIINTFRISGVYLKSMLKTPMFYVLLGLALLSIIFMVATITNALEVSILPTTRIILQIPALTYKMIMMLITFIYVGMLMHREKTNNVDQLVDVSPISNTVFLFSKFFAIAQLQLVLLLCFLIAGVSIQVYNGYFNFEFGLYFQYLFTIFFLELLIWAAVSFLMHSLIKNNYIAIFVLLLFWVGTSNLDQLDIDTQLVAFNNPGFMQYSDLNGFGNDLKAFYTIEFYWVSISIVFLCIAYLFWVRGVSNSIKERFSRLVPRFNKWVGSSMILAVIIACFLGFDIYKEEQKDIALLGESQAEALEEFTSSFARFSDLPQPRITSVYVELDLFPKTNSLKGKGSYKLTNKTANAIDTLMVKTGFDEISSIDLAVDYEVVQQNEYFQFYLIKLKESLAVGDSIELLFELQNKPNTLFTRYSNVLKNGTFLMQDVFPRIGYILGGEPKEPTDSNSTHNHLYAADSDLINFEAVLSTSSDQTLLAPGHLIKEWSAEGRNYYQYKLNQSIKYSLGINSARFESVHENYKGIDLEVYYHKGHDRNLKSMLSGLKASYDYNTHYFGAYQHDQARIIEFPQSEGSHATTYANNIPMSEVRFIAHSDTTKGKIDLSFYVPSHELTHQWWGSQITPANAHGARMLSESVTEYISLRIYEHAFGKDKALMFLNQQLDRYFKGRRWKKGNEPPLSMVKANQKYLFYGKGTVAFNTLSHFWGEENLNKLLADFLNEYKFKSAPYPTSLDLIEKLKQNVPDSLQYIIVDYFESVCFYENEIKEATVTKLSNGTYEINVDLSVRKFRGGEKNPMALNDFVELAVYNEEKELVVKRFKVKEVENKLTLVVKGTPTKLHLDPSMLMLEKELEDNEKILKL